MSAHANGNGPAIAEPLVVVSAEDAVDPALTGRAGVTYQSPPQSRGQAMSLVWLLLGWTGEPPPGDETWVAAIAGGRRVITVTEVAVP